MIGGFVIYQAAFNLNCFFPLHRLPFPVAVNFFGAAK